MKRQTKKTIEAVKPIALIEALLNNFFIIVPPSETKFDVDLNLPKFLTDFNRLGLKGTFLG